MGIIHLDTIFIPSQKRRFMVEVKEIFSPFERENIFKIRREVFVLEQGVSEEEEFDEYDSLSRHFLANYEKTPCGTARFRTTEKGIKLERFCVLLPYRNQNVGKNLVLKLVEEAKVNNPSQIYLHAQIQAMGFYEKLGFLGEGNIFLEANIEHKKMIFAKI
jgi:predicted GNAT family N-acyltransferase